MITPLIGLFPIQKSRGREALKRLNHYRMFYYTSQGLNMIFISLIYDEYHSAACLFAAT